MGGDLIYKVGPSLEEALELLQEAVRGRMVIVLIGRCRVRYSGRAGSLLEEGERVILLKNDGSLLVHRSTGYKPVNWQPPGSSASFRLEGGKLVITSVRERPVERIVIELSEVKAVFCTRLVDAAPFEMYMTEEELRDFLYSHPEVIEEGLRSVAREKELKSGKVDIFAVDKSGNPVVIEVKRGRVGEKEVLQLYRYVSELRLTNPGVRGVIVAPEIDSRAQVMLAELGLEYRVVDLAKLSRMREREGRGATLLDYYGGEQG